MRKPSRGRRMRMRRFIGLVAVSLMVSVPAFAQHGAHGGGGAVRVGGGFIPSHGPAPFGGGAVRGFGHGGGDEVGHPGGSSRSLRRHVGGTWLRPQRSPLLSRPALGAWTIHRWLRAGPRLPAGAAEAGTASGSATPSSASLPTTTA